MSLIHSIMLRIIQQVNGTILPYELHSFNYVENVTLKLGETPYYESFVSYLSFISCTCFVLFLFSCFGISQKSKIFNCFTRFIYAKEFAYPQVAIREILAPIIQSLFFVLFDFLSLFYILDGF